MHRTLSFPAIIVDVRPLPRVYNFGTFSLDSDSRLLFRDGERIPLPPKAADVLLALVERSGQLAKKEELLKAVWPDTFVEEGVLARHIFVLRQALGEVSKGLSFIETVPKRGYRFTAAVRLDGANGATHVEESTEQGALVDDGSKPEARYLIARAEFVRQKYLANAAAITLFKKAIELDPECALAWAGLAMTHTQVGYGFDQLPEHAFLLALDAVNRALAADPKLSLAHTVRGIVHLYWEHDWEAAKREFDNGIRFGPQDGEAHHFMSHYWVSVGRMEEAIKESDCGVQYDPLNFALSAHQIWLETKRKNYRSAVQSADPILNVDPHHPPTLFHLSRAYEEWGKLREAIEFKRRGGLNEPPASELMEVLTKEGPQGYWRAQLECLEARWRNRPTNPVMIAKLCTHLGRKDRALEWLERALEHRAPEVVYLNSEPIFERLRGEARFKNLIKAVGIPPHT